MLLLHISEEGRWDEKLKVSSEFYSLLGREETKSQRRNESPSNERIIHQLAILGLAEDKVVVVQKLDRSDSDTASTVDSDISLFEDLNALL